MSRNAASYAPRLNFSTNKLLPSGVISNCAWWYKALVSVRGCVYVTRKPGWNIFLGICTGLLHIQGPEGIAEILCYILVLARD